LRWVDAVRGGRRWPWLLCCVSLITCGGDSTQPTSHDASALVFIATPPDTVAVLTTLNPAPVIELRDAGGQRVRAAGISITASLDGGTLGGTSSVTTDTTGRATFSGLLASGPVGSHVVRFSAASLPALTRPLVLRAGAATRVTAQTPVQQSAEIGAAVAEAPAVTVTDGAGNPVAGVTVVFTVVAGGGAVGNGSSVTNAAGSASSASWTVGDAPGTNTLRASAADDTVLFTATATADENVVITAVADSFEGSVAEALADHPAVTVTDADGVPLSGRTVTFTVEGGGGTIADPVQVTDGAGHATAGAWTLGTIAGPQVLKATIPGVVPATFAALAHAGLPVELVVVGGNGQTAPIWHQLPQPVAIRANDQFGNVRPDVYLTFQVTSGGGRIVDVPTPPDIPDSVTYAGWVMGRATGPASLMVHVDENPAITTTVSATALAPQSPYDITVRYLSGSVGQAERVAVTAAVNRWRTIVVGDLADQQLNFAAGAIGGCPELPAIQETVDDIVLYVDLASIDGVGNVLGSAGPCVIRSGNGLPSVGYLRLDADDLGTLSQDEMDALLLHEMGHTLGFGTLWPLHGLLSGSGTTDPRFSGYHAHQQYNDMGGQDLQIPVEATGGDGTAESHWRESVFHNELMTGFIGAGYNPLTAMTIGSMADLSYTVDYASQESLGFPLSSLRQQATSRIRIVEQPLPGDITVVDAGGRVVGRRARRGP
jgi:hypothetical protein